MGNIQRRIVITEMPGPVQGKVLFRDVIRPSILLSDLIDFQVIHIIRQVRETVRQQFMVLRSRGKAAGGTQDE